MKPPTPTSPPRPPRRLLPSARAALAFTSRALASRALASRALASRALASRALASRALTILALTILAAGCGSSRAPDTVAQDTVAQGTAAQDTAATETAAPATRSWSPPAYGEAFRSTWRDGRAELAGYVLTYPRYGELRDGVAVAITVHEGGLDPETLVKVERSSTPHVPALKLNWVVDFQTGIYDYHLMTSAFVATGDAFGFRAGDPLRVSFGSQEWCGHVYAQSLFAPSAVHHTSHSYFEGEADEAFTLPRPDGALAEDALFLWARSLAGPSLSPGGAVEVPLLRSLAVARLDHHPLAWDLATLRRGEAPEAVEVPAGTFQADRFEAAVAAGDSTPRFGSGGRPAPARTWTFWVEREGARRVLRITRDDGYEARLLASERLPYWQLHGHGDEQLLERLGLRPRPPRTP